MKELKPCPFCGGKNTEILISEAYFIEYQYSIVCNINKGGCGARSGYYLTSEEAIEAWNRRTRHDD